MIIFILNESKQSNIHLASNGSLSIEGVLLNTIAASQRHTCLPQQLTTVVHMPDIINPQSIITQRYIVQLVGD